MIINITQVSKKECVIENYFFLFSYGPQREKTGLVGFENNKGADQPAHQSILLSVFVISILESIISKLATGEIQLF